MMKITGALLLAAAEAAKCPDLHQFRTATVTDGFEPAALAGKWYEVAYEDIAQVGAECQTAENEMTDTGFEQHFKAKYIDKILPFSQTYEYHANNMTDYREAGMYTKWLKGASALLQLPTVIVDVQAAADDEHYYLAEAVEEEVDTVQETNYEFLIEFTCYNKTPLIEVTELRFSAREAEISDEQFQKMK